MGDSGNNCTQHPADIITPPSWLDAALIQQALRNSGEEKSQVAKMTVSFATAPGDNYTSTIYRVKATLSDGGERSFFVKGPPPGVATVNFVKQSGFFRREAAMLADIIPRMEALLEEAAPGRFPPLAPRCYHHGSEPVEFLVLEDMSPAGFRMADRKRGLGLRHSLLAVRNLARFHASSHALLQRQPGLTDLLGNHWAASRGKQNGFVEGGLQGVADACRGWPDCEQYAELVEKFKPTALDTFAELNDPKPGDFNVITHGDFWVNNMMFRYEDGDPRETRAVDLQLSHVASPATDVLYLLAGSVSENVHVHHQDLLLREYHFALKEALELMGLQAPSLDALLAVINAHGPFAMFSGLCGIPIMKAERGANLDAMLRGNNSARVTLLNQPLVRKWIQRTLPDFVRKEWLPE